MVNEVMSAAPSAHRTDRPGGAQASSVLGGRARRHRAIWAEGGTADHAPLGELNTTPLIDVMLVLLVMFIVTIPIQSHGLKIDLPSPTPVHLPEPKPTANLVTIDAAGRLAWNGSGISEDELRSLLAETRRMSPEPELHLGPDAASRYELVDRTLATIKRSGVRRFGFVGNEAYRAG